MDHNRPQGRKKHVAGGGSGVSRRGAGRGTGPVGKGSGFFGEGGSPRGSGLDGGGRRAGGGGKMPFILVLLVLLLGGGGGLSSLFGGGGSNSGSSSPTPGASSLYESILGGSTGSYGGASSGSSSSSGGWIEGNNTGKLNRNVDSRARARYTKIAGDGSDTMTIMVYMCGTDLESRSAMASKDLQEMLNATISDKINLIVYTGGCSRWQNKYISSKVNQIYQIKGGQLFALNKDAGSVSMTDPDTLTSFIKWTAKKFPSNRNALIFWDHGGGSITGYGYDQKYPRSGSMSLSGINQALKNAGIKYDFIGFDACLMATVETAQMLSNYSDYMIASEETEPGVGWYYTNWLTKLNKNPAMETLEIGQMICDDFVTVCNQKCPGQQTTLSVVDLAELGETLGEEFTAFAKGTRNLIQNKEYATVSDARSNAREFARSSKIDQIDLVHFARNMGTEEGKKLAEVLLSAVKYNKTSSNMTNAYGISAYFPYQKASSVDSAVQTYNDIGIDSEYSRCIQEFASLEVSGQVATGGTSSPLSMLFGNGGGASQSGQSSGDIMNLLNAFMGDGTGSGNGISGLDLGNIGFFSGRSLSQEETADYIADHLFDAGALVWEKNDQGQQVMKLSDDQWSLVEGLELNMYYDDGSGYVDLGLDDIYDFDEEGNLIGETDKTWLSINGKPVAYYHLSTVYDGDNYTILGRVPALLNGEEVELILQFDQDHPDGQVLGAGIVYEDTETETLAKGLTEIKDGDKLEFLCDYYSYDGVYQDNYFLGEPLIVKGDLTIRNTKVGEGDVKAMYQFTDIYNQHYWSEPIPY